jgi:hypothetical protein
MGAGINRYDPHAPVPGSETLGMDMLLTLPICIPGRAPEEAGYR